MKNISELPFVPKWMGQPMYIGGVPVLPDNHSFGDLTLREIFYLTEDNGLHLDSDQFDFVKQYIIYYLNAPLLQMNDWPAFKAFADKAWYIRDTKELQKYVFDLLDYGIDIF